MRYQKQPAEIGFVGSKTPNLTWATRNVKIGPGRLKIITQTQNDACETISGYSTSHIHALMCHVLKDRQMERRQNTCKILLARQKRKSFLHRIITGNEKWIYFDNLKSKKSWVDPGQPSTSSARPNRLVGRLCSVFGGISRVSSTMSY